MVEDSVLLACDTASSVPDISKEHSAFISEGIEFQIIDYSLKSRPFKMEAPCSLPASDANYLTTHHCIPEDFESPGNLSSNHYAHINNIWWGILYEAHRYYSVSILVTLPPCYVTLFSAAYLLMCTHL